MMIVNQTQAFCNENEEGGKYDAVIRVFFFRKKYVNGSMLVGI